MAHKNNRRVVHGKHSQTFVSGTDVDVATFVVPAYTEVRIHAFKIFVEDALATSTVSVVDASNAVLSADLTLSLAATGIVEDALSASETVVITNNTASAVIRKIRVDSGESATGAFFYELHIDEPGI